MYKSTTVPLKSSKGQVGQGEVGVEPPFAPTRADQGTVVSVAGVHQKVSKQTQAINKSEVYSHYLGLLFCCILALMAHLGGKARMPYKNKGKCRGKKKNMRLTGRPTGH